MSFYFWENMGKTGENKHVASQFLSEKSCSDSSSIQESRRHVKIPGKNSKNSKISVNKAKKLEPRRRSDEDRVPDGPYIGEGEVKSENFAAKIKETLRKGGVAMIYRVARLCLVDISIKHL